MWSIRKINPMARAVGTMGAVAALVGGITFAAATSNTVALTPNNITTGTAALVIGPAGCATTGTTQQGFAVSSLAPGDSTSVSFCLDNMGTVPLSISTVVPQNLSGSAAAQATTLSVDCGLGGALAGPLSGYGPAAFANPLPAGGAVNCTATATLSSSFTGNGEAIPAFSVNYTGTQVVTQPE